MAQAKKVKEGMVCDQHGNCRRVMSSKCVNFEHLTMLESVSIVLVTFLSVTAGVLFSALV